MVSEIMLQQTQADRVVGYWQTFLAALPTPQSLAKADTATLLSLWQGLGYNRRALALGKTGVAIVKNFSGNVPKTEEDLRSLPGIGPYTAGAIRAFAYNQPGVFLETNIRTVYIHHFFADQEKVTDNDLLPIVAATTDQKNPREWYWALMDYGAYLKKTTGNATKRSKTYSKQKAFKGSDRQVRGRIIRILLSQQQTLEQLGESTGENRERLTGILGKMVQEGLVAQRGAHYHIPTKNLQR